MKPVCVTMATRASWLSSCARALEDAHTRTQTRYRSGKLWWLLWGGPQRRLQRDPEVCARPTSKHLSCQTGWWAQQMPPRSRAMKPPYQRWIELPTSANHSLLGGWCSIDTFSKWRLWSPREARRLQRTKGRVSIKHPMVPWFWKHAFKSVQLSVSRFHGYRKRFNNNMSSTLLSWKFNFQFNFTLISACIKVNNLEEMERCISPLVLSFLSLSLSLSPYRSKDWGGGGVSGDSYQKQ